MMKVAAAIVAMAGASALAQVPQYGNNITLEQARKAAAAAAADAEARKNNWPVPTR